MAYAPVMLFALPMEDYAGYWVKFYEQGTVTPLSMATDAGAGTLLAKAEVSSGGTVPIGYIKTAGDALFIPFVDGDYDAWLFPTSTEADANDTTNAIQVADNLNADPLNAIFNSDTIDSIANLRLETGIANQQVEVISHAAPNFALTEPFDGGGGMFVWDDGSTETDDNGITIKATATATGRWIRVYSGMVNVKWFGALGDGSTDDTTAIQAAIDYQLALTVNAPDVTGGDRATAPTIFFPTGIYVISSTVTIESSYANFFGEDAVIQKTTGTFTGSSGFHANLTGFRMSFEGLQWQDFATGVYIDSNNINSGRVLFKRCGFFSHTLYGVHIDCQSSTTVFDDCIWRANVHEVYIEAGDMVMINGG